MDIYIDCNKLNKEKFNYLNQIFEDYDGNDFDSFYTYLSYLNDCNIYLSNYSYEQYDFVSNIIRLFNDVNEDYNNINLSYMDIKENNNITLDINILNEYGHEYLKDIFDFPDYYGENLDALYDCLSEKDNLLIDVVNMTQVNDLSLKILNVINDVSHEYGNIIIKYEGE